MRLSLTSSTRITARPPDESHERLTFDEGLELGQLSITDSVRAFVRQAFVSMIASASAPTRPAAASGLPP